MPFSVAPFTLQMLPTHPPMGPLWFLQQLSAFRSSHGCSAVEQLDGKTTAQRQLEQLAMNLPQKHPRFGTFRTKDDPIDLKDAFPSHVCSISTRTLIVTPSAQRRGPWTHKALLPEEILTVNELHYTFVHQASSAAQPFLPQGSHSADPQLFP